MVEMPPWIIHTFRAETALWRLRSRAQTQIVPMPKMGLKGLATQLSGFFSCVYSHSMVAGGLELMS